MIFFLVSEVLRIESEIEELVIHGRAKAGDSIVARDGSESGSAAAVHLSVTRGDIGEGGRILYLGGIKERVDPSHGRHALCSTSNVHHGDESGEGGGSSGSASDGDSLTVCENLEIGRYGGQIRECATRMVEEGQGVRDSRVANVVVDNGVLEGRAREII